MTDEEAWRLDELREEARYRRERLELYRARMYGGRSRSEPRLSEYEQGYELRIGGPMRPSERRLDRAAIQAGRPELPLSLLAHSGKRFGSQLCGGALIRDRARTARKRAESELGYERPRA